MAGIQRSITILLLSLPLSTVAEPHWKVRMDPLLAVADYANLELDRRLNPRWSTGLMAWHNDSGLFNGTPESSFGLRLDWFQNGVFAEGWHSNGMVRAEWRDNTVEQWRLKGTQTYQWVLDGFFINAGIGAQLLFTDDGASEFEWGVPILPAWELSVGRSF